MKKLSRSTVLFLLGSFLTLLAIGLALIIPGNQVVLSLIGVVGLLVAIWQKFRGDIELQKQFEQERKVNAVVAQNMAINASELRIISALHAAPETMLTKESQS